MNYLTIFMLISTSSVFVQAITMKEAKVQIMAAATDCMAKVGAGKEQLEEMFMKSKDISQPAKCLRKCLMEQFGMIDGKGDLSKDGVMKVAQQFMGGDAAAAELDRVIGEMVEKCSKLKDADACQSAFNYCHCMAEEVASKNINISFV